MIIKDDRLAVLKSSRRQIEDVKEELLEWEELGLTYKKDNYVKRTIDKKVSTLKHKIREMTEATNIYEDRIHAGK